MAGVNGRYESVIRGVSQQTPHDRREGQMEAQDNLLSDPVHGATRRWGGLHLDEMNVSSQQMTDDKLINIAGNMLTQEYFCDGREYELVYAKKPITGISPIYCFDKLSNRFIPVTLESGLAANLASTGISSMVNIGRFMLIAAEGVNPTYTQSNVMPACNDAKDGVIWIRQGSYSRTYSCTFLRPDGTSQTVTHTTMSASYEGNLDTSDIPWDEDGRYNKAVSDRVNAYNAAVTKHIAESTRDIQPDIIAAKLADKIRNQLGLSTHIAVNGSYIYFSASANIANVTTSDGGDSTYIRAVVDTLDDIDKLSPWHYNNKVIRISPKKQSGSDTYYVKAVTKTGQMFGEVTWKECPGVLIQPQQTLCVAWCDGSRLYVGSTPAGLNSITSNRAAAPLIEESSAGDTNTSPIPYFLTGHPIHYIGIFQDRLLICSGAVVFASRPGDYFNWFRQTILEVLDDDPVEMYALGSEDDVIRWDSSFDRNHILHGYKNQYLLPGRTNLTPKNPSIQIMSSIRNSVGSRPQTSGSFVFFTKAGAAGGSLHQIQIGATTDSTDVYECSSSLDTYIDGEPCEIVCITSPYLIVMRTRNSLNKLFIYTYLDSMQGGERLFDSWSRWVWDEKMGPCCGITYYNERLIKFSLRRWNDGVHIVAERIDVSGDTSPEPHLDGRWNFGSVLAQYQSWPQEQKDRLYVVYGSQSDKKYIGCRLADVNTYMPEVLQPDNAAKAWIGWCTDAVLVLTNPFMRDRNGSSIINGRLTLSALNVSVDNTGGMLGYVTAQGRNDKTMQFEGRVLAGSTNLIGTQPLVDKVLKVPVYKEIRECQVELRSVTWLPLTISGIEWKGQYFNNLQRV